MTTDELTALRAEVAAWRNHSGALKLPGHWTVTYTPEQWAAIERAMNAAKESTNGKA